MRNAVCRGLRLIDDLAVDDHALCFALNITQWVAAEDGNVCILANLQPRTIRGIESQGMILMAKQLDGKMRFITPAETLSNGAIIG